MTRSIVYGDGMQVRRRKQKSHRSSIGRPWPWPGPNWFELQVLAPPVHVLPIDSSAEPVPATCQWYFYDEPYSGQRASYSSRCIFARCWRRSLTNQFPSAHRRSESPGGVSDKLHNQVELPRRSRSSVYNCYNGGGVAGMQNPFPRENINKSALRV